MDMDEYQDGAETTAQYPRSAPLAGCGSGGLIGLSYTVLGLASESGEVAGKLKKYIRGDDGLELPEARRQQLIEELGDVLWYVAMTATELDVPLAEVARRNLEKLAARAREGKIQGDGDER